MIAYLLQKKVDVLIFRSQYAVVDGYRNGNRYNQTTMEIGATWFSKPSASIALLN
jgi:hypothetical protein